MRPASPPLVAAAAGVPTQASVAASYDSVEWRQKEMRNYRKMLSEARSLLIDSSDSPSVITLDAALSRITSARIVLLRTEVR